MFVLKMSVNDTQLIILFFPSFGQLIDSCLSAKGGVFFCKEKGNFTVGTPPNSATVHFVKTSFVKGKEYSVFVCVNVMETQVLIHIPNRKSVV